ncbi:hypothetical protein HYPGJ_40152 [Hyphomicrobium sp. GJ21]|nr:hypothetical protein HYPGJ_40152 [Hyphomicrobium sp. GJ21]
MGQPDPLASRARCGQGDRPSPHGMRETVCGISRFLKWPDRNPVLGLSRSGPVPRPKLRRPRRGTRPLRALLFCLRHPTPLRGAGRMARVLFRAGRLRTRSFLCTQRLPCGEPAASTCVGRRSSHFIWCWRLRLRGAGRQHRRVSSFFALSVERGRSRMTVSLIPGGSILRERTNIKRAGRPAQHTSAPSGRLRDTELDGALNRGILHERTATLPEMLLRIHLRGRQPLCLSGVRARVEPASGLRSRR